MTKILYLWKNTRGEIGIQRLIDDFDNWIDTVKKHYPNDYHFAVPISDSDYEKLIQFMGKERHTLICTL
jgi:hypothetical protein